jgi:hypothetical protein
MPTVYLKFAMFIYRRWIGNYFLCGHYRTTNTEKGTIMSVSGIGYPGYRILIIRRKIHFKKPAKGFLHGQEAHLIFLELCLLLCPPLLEEEEMLLQVLHIKAGGVQLMAQLPVLQPGGITSRGIISSCEVSN